MFVLSPPQGEPGSGFTAVAAGFDSCDAIGFHWDDGQNLGEAPANRSGVSANLQVPDKASAGPHHVTLSCGDLSATRDFNVVAPATKAELALTSDSGTPGTTVTGTATGFGACADPARSAPQAISLLWDGRPHPATITGTDTLNVSFVVPSDVSSESHSVTVTLTCESAEAEASFEVVPAENPSLTIDKDQELRGNAALSLTPSNGRPGDTVSSRENDSSALIGPRASNCSGTANNSVVRLRLHRATSIPRSPSQRTPIKVTTLCAPPAPTDRPTFPPASESTSQAKNPTVTPTTPPDSGGPEQVRDDGIPGWVWVLIVAVLIAAALAYHRWHSPRPRKPVSVVAVSRPGGPPLVTMRETPVRGEATHAIRLKTRPDVGTLTIKEVDDD